MHKRTGVSALVAVAALLSACSGTSSSSAEAFSSGGDAGELHFAMKGEGVDSTIVIRNVFEPDDFYLIECMEKDHLLDGQAFCDELVVLPPGVYEVKVQSQDPNCRSEKDHYKILVEPRKTVELDVKLFCSDDGGGLDVIVTSWNQPSFDSVQFETEGGAYTNKNICQYEEDVWVTINVKDSDTDCDDLSVNWSVTDGAAAASLILQETTGPHAPDGSVCHFSALLDSSVVLGTYRVTFTVSDDETPTNFLKFPVYIIDCGNGS
ncbi:hypothetical protein [Vulgatibacter sp.]|uniref:hypothetical protein n=1 Tax=Vulgatibacter sp. TaxID=1971226 RepID=UPI00356ADD2F